MQSQLINSFTHKIQTDACQYQLSEPKTDDILLFHVSGRITLQARDSNTPEPLTRALLKKRKSEVCVRRL